MLARGVIKWRNGNRYEDEWQDGRPHGQGKRTWRSGVRYEGDSRDGDFHGRGTFTFASGSRYEGQWRKGCTSMRPDAAVNMPSGSSTASTVSSKWTAMPATTG